MRAMYMPILLFFGILLAVGMMLALAGQLSRNPAQLVWLFLAVYLLGIFLILLANVGANFYHHMEQYQYQS